MTTNGPGRVNRPSSFRVLTAFVVVIVVSAAEGLLAPANVEDFYHQGRSTGNVEAGVAETVRDGGASCGDEARVRRIETFHIDTGSIYPPDLAELHIRENVKVRFLRDSY